MRKNIVMIVAALTMAAGSLTAQADPYDYRWGVDNNRYSPYHPSNRYYPGPHYPQHRSRSSKDEWAWALGGIIVGAVIANSANKERPAQRQEDQVTLPPRPKRKVQVCEDVIAYDNDGKPYVLRQCTITEQ